ARTKVGAPLNSADLFVYDIKRDTVLQVKIDSIPGITDVPAFRKNYPEKTETKNEKGEKKEKKPEQRAISFSRLIWSEDGKRAVIQIRAVDNKDRWIMSL